MIQPLCLVTTAIQKNITENGVICYNMEEIWRTIDWRPLYEVSNLGRVRNRKSGKILATNPTKSHKHPQVWLYSEFWNSTEQYTLSYIVYNTFNENKVGWPKRIKHLDGDITNNNLNNLSTY